MKKVTIAPIGVTEEQWKRGFSKPFRLSYTGSAGKQITITTSNRAVYGPPQPTDRVKQLMFDKSNKTITLTFDNKDIDVYRALMDCPYLDHPDNKTTMPRLFTVVDYDKAVVNEVSVLKKKLTVMNKVNSMSEREMRDVLFFMGENPVNMTDSEMLVKLIGLDKGVLMNGMQPNGVQNYDYFIEKFDDTTDAQMSVMLRKAVHFSIIETKGGHYYLGSQLIGANFEDLIIYFRQNEQMYNSFVARQVQQKDVLPNENYAVPAGQPEAGDDAEMIALKETAKQIKVIGYALIKDKVKLENAIIRRKKEMERQTTSAQRKVEKDAKFKALLESVPDPLADQDEQ